MYVGSGFSRTLNDVMMHALIILLLQGAAAQPPSITTAATKHVPEVRWQAKSVVAADFTCRGRKEQAILGTSRSEIVIAIFVNGTDQPPQILRYSAEVRDPRTATLAVEDLDYDPNEVGPLPGFKASRTCKGLNLSDGQVDSAHIYWNHTAARFDDWVLQACGSSVSQCLRGPCQEVAIE